MKYGKSIRESCNIPPEFDIVLTHIKDIKTGDTICHKKKVMTVCRKDIKECKLMGRSIFGDSYISGHALVMKLVYINPLQKKHRLENK